MYIILSYVDLLLFLCYIHYIITNNNTCTVLFFPLSHFFDVYYWISTRRRTEE